MPVGIEGIPGTVRNITEIFWEEFAGTLRPVTEMYYEDPPGTVRRVFVRDRLNSYPLSFTKWRDGWLVLQDGNLPNWQNNDTNEDYENSYPRGIYHFSSDGTKLGRVFNVIEDGPAGILEMSDGKLAVAQGTFFGVNEATLLARYTLDMSNNVTEIESVLPNNSTWRALQGYNPGNNTFRSSSIHSVSAWSGTSVLVSVASRESNSNSPGRYTRDSIYVIDMTNGTSTLLHRRSDPNSRLPFATYESVAGDGTDWWFSSSSFVYKHASPLLPGVQLMVDGVPAYIFDMQYESSTRIWCLYRHAVDFLRWTPGIAAYNPTTAAFEPDDNLILRI